MLRLPPRVIDTDDGEKVVDQDGYELVLRTSKGKTGYRTYHYPDPEAAKRGEKEIECVYGERTIARRDIDLLWRRKTAIEGIWTECSHCTSDDETLPNNSNKGKQGTSLAHKLEADDDTREKVNTALNQRTG